MVGAFKSLFHECLASLCLKKRIENTAMKKLLYTLLTLAFFTVSSQAQRVLSLEECIEIALSNNLNIKRARNNAIGAKASVLQSKMNFLPSLNANASHSWAEGLQFDNTSGTLVNATTLGGGGGISAGVSLFDGFSNVLGLKRDKYLYQAAEESVRSNVQVTEANIVEAFLNVILTREGLKIAEQRKDLLNDQLDREEKRERAGVGNMEAVYNFRSQVAQQDLTIVNQRNQLETRKLTLIQLLLLDPADQYEFEGVTLNDSDLEKEIEAYATVYDKSVAFSPSIKSAELSLKASENSLKIAQNAWMPSLSASGRYGSNWTSNFRNQDGSVVEISQQLEQNVRKSAGISLNIPIFNNFRVRTQRQQSKINMLNSELTLEQAKNTVTNSIQQAYLNLVNAKTSYAAAKESVLNLNTSFEFAKNRYENGTIDFVTYLQSLNGKNRGEFELVQAKNRILFRQLVLDILTGELEMSTSN